jgi:hypothetical protein
MLLLSMNVALNRLEHLKQDVNGFIEDARHKVDDWAGLKADGWKPGVPNSSSPLEFMGSAAKLGEALSAPGMFLYHHFMENIGGASSASTGAGGTARTVIDRVLAVIASESDIMVDAIKRIKSELIDGSAYASMSLGDVLKKLTGIVVDAFLNSAENPLDALLDFLVLVARAGLEDLDTPIRIPVLSDILEEFGISIGFSVLDVLLMIAAVPATIGYKLAHGSAPLSSGDGFSDKILAARTPSDLVAGFRAPAPVRRRAGPAKQFVAAAADDSQDGGGSINVGVWIFSVQLSDADARTVYVVGHAIAGLGALISTALTPGVLTDTSEQAYARALTAAGLVSGVAAGFASFVDSAKPIQNTSMAAMAKVLSILTLVAKLANGPVTNKIFGGNATDQQKLKVGKALDATFAFLALTPTCTTSRSSRPWAQVSPAVPRSSTRPEIWSMI